MGIVSIVLLPRQSRYNLCPLVHVFCRKLPKVWRLLVFNRYEVRALQASICSSMICSNNCVQDGWRRSEYATNPWDQAVEVVVAIRGTDEGAFGSGDTNGGDGGTRQIFRFGQKLSGENVPSVPARYRGGPGGPTGRVVAALLRPSSGEIWLRIRSSDAPWQRQVRTIPLNTDQPPTPTPESVELRGGVRVNCHDGYVGRLEGFALDTHAGIVQYIVVRIRSNVLADVENPSDPLFKLVEVGGQQLMLSPSWIVSATHESSGFPFGSGSARLMLAASAEQVASGIWLRTDGELTAAIWSILNENPAIAPYAGQLRVLVHDGDVTLRGSLPSPRHRASAEQDVWHVPGVLAVHNEVALGE